MKSRADELPMTHAALVHRACSWLRSQGAAVISCDGGPDTGEIPDVIGWDAAGWSTLVECKATRGDFHRDREKPCRAGLGMGRLRYYLCRRGVIQPNWLPPGWGLLWCNERAARVVVPAPVQGAWDRGEEMSHLLGLCRRLLARAAGAEPSTREAAAASDGSGQ